MSGQTVYSIPPRQFMPGWSQKQWPPKESPTLVVFKVFQNGQKGIHRAVEFSRELMLAEPAVQAALAECWADRRVAKPRGMLVFLYNKTGHLAVHREFWKAMHPALLERVEESARAAQQAENDAKISAVVAALQPCALDVEAHLGTAGICRPGEAARHFAEAGESAGAESAAAVNYAAALDAVVDRPPVWLGHNFGFDLEVLTRVVPGHSMLLRPVIDTLVLAAVLAPRHPGTLALGGTHRADQDAEQTVALWRQQVLEVAAWPAAWRARLADVAPKGVQAMLEAVGEVFPQPPPAGEAAPAPDPVAELSDDQRAAGELLEAELEARLAALPVSERTLVVCPRVMLPRVARRAGTRVLDPSGQPVYLRRDWAAQPALADDAVPPTLRLLLTAFEEACRAGGHDTHVAQMADWLRYQLDEPRQADGRAVADDLLVPWAAVADELLAGGTGAATEGGAPWLEVLPLDQVDAVGEVLAGRSWQRLIVVGAELTPEALVHELGPPGKVQPDIRRLLARQAVAWTGKDKRLRYWLERDERGD